MVSCHDGGVVGEGPLDAQVMGIGIAPGRDEWEKTKRPFTGSAGRLLNATLKAVKVNRDDLFLTNLLCWWEDSPTPDEIEQCLPRLRAEISAVQPKLIVTFGNIVTEAFLGWMNQKPGKLRGGVHWSERHNCWILPTYHPAAFLHDKGDFKLDVADLARDLMKIPDIVTWPDDYRPWDVPFELVTDAERADEILWSLDGYVSLDVETSYDYKPAEYLRHVPNPEDFPAYRGSKLLCFGISDDRGTFVFPGDVAARVHSGWAERPNVKWIMQGGMFDKAEVKHLLEEHTVIAEDTLLQSYSLDERGGQAAEQERAVGIHGLKGLAREYLGAGFYDVKVLEAPPEKLHPYNAKDAYYTRNLYFKFKPRQEADNVRGFYEQLLIPGANALSEIQDRGVFIDRSVLRELALEWMPLWLQLEEELREEAREIGWPGDLNMNSAPQMIKFVYDVLGAKPTVEGRTTKNNVMEKLAEKYPWCEKLRKWRQINHMIGTYITGIEDDIKEDSRAHPEPLIHGSRGGRLAYHKPPVQTLPNKGVDPSLARLRRMFAATPRDIMNPRESDYVIIESDLKQAELWATWMYSGDEALLAALESGDVHGETAKDVFGITSDHPDWKVFRYLTKTISFGILYGRGAPSFATDMWKGHQPPAGFEVVRWSVKEAQAYIDRWAKKYPRVWAWRKEEIANALKNGEQASWTGRKRRYWMPNYQTLAQAVNFGPQTLAHDCLFDSLIKLHELLKPLDAHILFEVHDSLVIEANKAHLDKTLKLIKEVMEEPKFGNARGIPVDIAVGPSWLEVQEVHVD